MSKLMNKYDYANEGLAFLNELSMEEIQEIKSEEPKLKKVS